jgi:hypothetical protein
MSKRDAFVNQLKAQIDDWNAQIDKLEASAKEAQATARAGQQQQLEELCRRRDEARVQMTKAQEASDAAWEDMRAGFEAAWDSISDAFQSAMKRYR